MQCKVKIIVRLVEDITINTKGIDGKEASQKALEKVNKKYGNKILDTSVNNWSYGSLFS